MIEPIVRVMLVVRDLLELPESQIHRGRTGAQWEYESDLNIAIDSLAQAQATSKSEFFDGFSEALTYQSWWRQVFTVSVFGANAYTIASKLHHMLSSDLSLYKQFEHKIAISSASNITDVKLLTQHNYINRYDIEITAEFATEFVADIKRIDEALIKPILTNN